MINPFPGSIVGCSGSLFLVFRHRLKTNNFFGLFKLYPRPLKKSKAIFLQSNKTEKSLCLNFAQGKDMPRQHDMRHVSDRLITRSCEGCDACASFGVCYDQPYGVL
jgi:hypothetical protein